MTDALPDDKLRESLILAVSRGFHEFAGGHPDYPDYDEVGCGASTEYHCEAGRVGRSANHPADPRCPKCLANRAAPADGEAGGGEAG